MTRWLYSQAIGELSREGAHVATCYSGYGDGKNQPGAQDQANIGPIPQGLWFFGTLSADPAHGPLARHLIPASGTDTFGRSGFLLHGDSREHPGAASHGCIIAPRPARELAREGDELLVTP